MPDLVTQKKTPPRPLTPSHFFYKEELISFPHASPGLEIMEYIIEYGVGGLSGGVFGLNNFSCLVMHFLCISPVN